jgi:hypothetical protein
VARARIARRRPVAAGDGATLAFARAGYALRSPALSQAREAAWWPRPVMTVEGTDGVAHAAHGPARAGLCGRPGTRSHLQRLSRGSEGDTPLARKQPRSGERARACFWCEPTVSAEATRSVNCWIGDASVSGKASRRRTPSHRRRPRVTDLSEPAFRRGPGTLGRVVVAGCDEVTDVCGMFTISV